MVNTCSSAKIEDPFANEALNFFPVGCAFNPSLLAVLGDIEGREWNAVGRPQGSCASTRTIIQKRGGTTLFFSQQGSYRYTEGGVS